MRYPLDRFNQLANRYTFGVRTSYSNFHLGLDKVAVFRANVYAPVDGKIVRRLTGTQGGKTIHFIDRYGKLWRFLHLDAMIVFGNVKEGQIIGKVGNTGLVSPMPDEDHPKRGAHLHFDISQPPLDIYDTDRFVDPIKYFETYLDNPIKMTIQNLSKLQRDNIQALLDGTVVLGYEVDSGKFYEVKDSKKEEFTDMELIRRHFFAAGSKDTFDKIPNK